MSAQNYIDIGVIVVVLILAIRGMQNGLIQEIAALIGFVLGLYLATKYFALGAEYIGYTGLEFENESISWILSFIIILSLVWVLCLVIGAVVSRFVVIMPSLNVINYFGGYLFAALKYFLILSAILYGLSQVEFLKKPIADNFKATATYPVMMEIAQKIMNFETFKEMQKEMSKGVSKISNKAKEDAAKQGEKVKKDILDSVLQSIK
ncbi:CvpA family protein [Helicobacter saguini]|uniref:CvpA family protein n=1 Tax=Helicobacter saguini TaxID=1548018 RepID=A0A347VRS1_9HELI|nr:CvpA family protein [Helicobacter saguini]MWV62797.1 CvpA family protein [Helicobacter saguini]MWV66534.1 CvpA family protein [Helicobacter saguini]MWV68883.1 CvpA family protein [Helicobacter saguini]MWV71563.1 CvpA family protein [Helicobacter saguini]TLD93655.1 CvpA family protein [Helicobacter saguini]